MLILVMLVGAFVGALVALLFIEDVIGDVTDE